MPRRYNLSRDYVIFRRSTDDLIDFYRDVTGVPVRHARLLGEIVFLRAFSLLEDIARITAVKLVAGAEYCDGTAPQLSTTPANLILSSELLLR